MSEIAVALGKVLFGLAGLAAIWVIVVFGIILAILAYVAIGQLWQEAKVNARGRWLAYCRRVVQDADVGQLIRDSRGSVDYSKGDRKEMVYRMPKGKP